MDGSGTRVAGGRASGQGTQLGSRARVRQGNHESKPVPPRDHLPRQRVARGRPREAVPTRLRRSAILRLPRTSSSSLGNHIPGIDLWDSYGSNDYRFLSSQIIVIKAPEKGPARPYWQAKPEDFEALRESLYQGFQSLPMVRSTGSTASLITSSSRTITRCWSVWNRSKVSVYENGRSIPPHGGTTKSWPAGSLTTSFGSVYFRWAASRRRSMRLSLCSSPACPAGRLFRPTGQGGRHGRR